MIDYVALKAAILASPACQQYIVTNDMPKDPDYYAKDKAIADIFNTPAGTRLYERFENFVGIMGAVGITVYNGVMRSCEVVADAGDKLMADFIAAVRSDKGINFGDPQTQAVLDNFVATSVLTAEQASIMKGIGQAPSSLAWDTVGQPITVADVSIALRNY